MSTEIGRGGGRVLSPAECGLIAACHRAIRGHWTANGMPPPALLEILLTELRDTHLAALELTPTSDLPSEVLPLLTRPASAVEEYVWLPTKVAADRLDISDRAVRYLAKSGRLVGQKRGAGRGTWLISEQSVTAYRDGASSGIS